MSLQLYVQPLVVSGSYVDFKEFTTPREFQFAIYGKDKGTIVRDPATGLITIDPGNGNLMLIGDPDFNFRSLLGNAVLRWEYRPGSTLFLVWQQRRQDVESFAISRSAAITPDSSTSRRRTCSRSGDVLVPGVTGWQRHNPPMFHTHPA
jgi:hypothetical protein